MNTKIEIGVIGIAILLLAAVSAAADRKTYIIQMKHFDQMKATVDVKEDRYFESSLESVSELAVVMYKYEHTMNGFATTLTLDEAKALAARPEVLSVRVETVYELHTTRTPFFLGLDQSAALLPNPQQLSNVIVGVIDTGVWPESKSFDDTGLGPIPSKWKGFCETGTNFSKSMCNKKLVGARYFSKGYENALEHWYIDWTLESKSPRDDNGHGTHTSTTAAGSAVSSAGLFGYAVGTARGMASGARVATYKVCWKAGCFETDIMAAMDAAIADNVDVMSLSIGGGSAPYDMDTVAIGAYKAMENGILVSCSAGNSGPRESTLSNVAPWITTVGAGTLDREFPSTIKLGNGNTYVGVSLYNGKSLDGKLVPFVYAGSAKTFGGNDIAARLCLPGTLDPKKVSGNIVLCDRGKSPRVQKGLVVHEAGGAGMILANTAETGEELVADAHLYLATAVGVIAGNAMKQYLSSQPENATATISFEGTKLDVQPAPVVAAFSSRGPNAITPDILKPDLIAPGVNILAGWTGLAGPTGLDVDTRRVPFNIISGTSMSCPHVSGLAALVKAAHPKWSPAAIRSALMTTAYTAYNNGNPILDIATGKPSTPFDHGAGHVDPVRALDPGLVYDINATDYLDFLCSSGYTSDQINAIAGKPWYTCNNKGDSVNYLNYPSFAISIPSKTLGNTETTVVTHVRKLTNVGAPGIYKIKIISPSQLVKISVVPWKLTFNQTNEQKSYNVTFKVQPNTEGDQFGRIEWSSEKHVVGSPVAVSWYKYIRE